MTGTSTSQPAPLNVLHPHLAQARAAGARVPSYDRQALTPGVVHLGLGAFHRAHQALVFDGLLEAGDPRWGIFGVAMRSTHVADPLAAQGGLYSIEVVSTEGSRWQVPGALLGTCVAARERAAVVAALAAPATRWVTITVTEKGYTPELFRLIADGLRQRRAAGLAGLTLSPCDNLSGNGRVLRAGVLAQAAEVDPLSSDWMDAHCAFPCSMVDRIVPASTPAQCTRAADVLGLPDRTALAVEPFTEWAIERRFVDANDAQALASQGVTVVDDVRPYEEAKLRMLNASNTAVALTGAVLGFDIVSQALTDPQHGAALTAFASGFIHGEAAPHLTRPQIHAYGDALLARFANRALAHSVHQIATDTSQKISQRLPPTLLTRLEAQLPVNHLALIAAAWVRYLRGVDERGRTHAINDPMAAPLQALVARHGHDVDALTDAVTGLPSVWGEPLVQHDGWRAQVRAHSRLVHAQGMAAALKALQS